MLMLRIGEKFTCRGWKVIQHFLNNKNVTEKSLSSTTRKLQMQIKTGIINYNITHFTIKFATKRVLNQYFKKS